MGDTNFIPLPSIDYSCNFWCWGKFVILPIAVATIIFAVATIIFFALRFIPIRVVEP